MTLFPPAGILVALAGACLLVLVLLLGGRFEQLRPPGLRYKAALLVAAAAWILGIVLVVVAGARVALVDIVAGVAVLLEAAILAFIAWSLTAWGFTVNVLLALAGTCRPLDLDGWAAAYAGGRGIPDITADRAAVLLAAGLGRVSGDGYVITPAGRLAARVVGVLRRLFGLGA